MNFYQISHAHNGGRQYPWASGYGPLPKLEDMPFLEGMEHPFKASLLRSWEVNATPPGIEIDPGGREWSHFIGNGSGNPSFFVSEMFSRISEMLKLEYCVPPQCRLPALRRSNFKSFLLLNIIYWKLFRGWKSEVQLAARNENPPRWIDPYQTKCKANTWNGKDLFSSSQARCTHRVYCTDRVKDLAESCGWTNVKFKSVDMTE